MMTDQEILCQALEQYACNTAKSLLGVSSVPAQTLIRYAIRNMFSKYGTVVSMFSDASGKINVGLLRDAFTEELKVRGGVSVFGIKFMDTDVKEIFSIYNRLSSGGNV